MHDAEPAIRTIKHYRIEAKLGEGGMGVVYRAFDTILQRRVALKVLSSTLLNDPSHRRRFEQEARSASAISHGNVAHIYEVGESGGESFIAMEYVEGQTLQQVMAARPLELREILKVALQVTDALDVAHSKGIVHRDVKPGNIMIDGRGQAKVLDFGLARVSSARTAEEVTALAVTKTGSILGTGPYMSPEQARGLEVDHRSDIFSVGAVLYEMVTRKLAFDGSTFTDTLLRVVQSQPEPIGELAPSTPRDLISVIERCLEKDKEKRYQHTSNLVEDLLRIQSRGESAHPYSAGRPVDTAQGRDVRRAPRARRLVLVSGLSMLTLAILATAWWVLGTRSRYESIAVLPFVNQSGDPELEYLSDGLTESVINGISRIRGVTVVSRGSTFSFKGKELDVPEVARKLHVAAVLTGTVMVTAGNVRVRAELTDAASRQRIWGEEYTRPLSAVVLMQDEIAGELARQLTSDIGRDEGQLAGSRATDSAEAYRLYLKGRYHWNKRTVEGLKAAIGFFQQAIDHDPTYALAYAGMADAYMLLSNVMPPAEAFGKAKSAANKALEIDKSLAEPYATMGYISLHYDWNWAEAETNLKRSSDLNPNYPTARSLYARYLTVIGQFPDSVQEMGKAQQLDPLAVGIATGIGLSYYYARRYDDAIASFNKALELNPRFVLALLDRGDAHVQKRQFREAFESYDQALALSPKDAGGIAQRGHGYAAAGRRQDAAGVITELQKLAGERYVSPYSFALVYAGLRDTNSAMDYLERGFNERTSPMVFVNVEPAFDSIRQDARFRALVRRMNLVK